MRRAWEVLATTALVLMWGVLAVHWHDVPDRIPSHFDAAGNPTRWTGPYRVWFMPITASLLYLTLTVLARLQLRRTDRANFRETLAEMMTSVKAVAMVGSLWLHVQVMMIAIGILKSPGPLSTLVSVGAVTVAASLYSVRLWHISRA